MHDRACDSLTARCVVLKSLACLSLLLFCGTAAAQELSMALSGDVINLDTNQTAPYYVSFELNTSSGNLTAFPSNPPSQCPGGIQNYMSTGMTVSKFHASVAGQRIPIPAHTFADMGGRLFGGCGMENGLGIGSGFFIDWVSGSPPIASKNPILSILQMPFGSLVFGLVGGHTIDTMRVSVPEPNVLVLFLVGLAFLSATRSRLAPRRGP